MNVPHEAMLAMLLEMLDVYVNHASRRLLPPSCEVQLWALTEKPVVLHLQLGVVMHKNGRFSDLTPHPNLVQFADEKWRKRARATVYVVSRSPMETGILYQVIDACGGMQEFRVNNLVAGAELFFHGFAALPVSAGMARTVFGGA